MNTKNINDQNESLSIGACLRNAREKLGLSQQVVAERLFLKISTVRDIEEDKTPTGLASTFLRGYIRSYARLVHLSEEDLQSIMNKQSIMVSKKHIPMQSFSIKKDRKKLDKWLINFTWLVLFVLIGLTSLWWWQNYNIQQINTVNQSLDRESNNKNYSIDKSFFDKSIQSPISRDGNIPSSQLSINNTITNQKMIPSNIVNNSESTHQLSHITPVINNILHMHFNDDCWLEVIDANNKKLFSGLQHKNENLNLTGQAPYKLKIGAPAAIEIKYLGKPVDLKHSVKNNHIAYLLVQ